MTRQEWQNKAAKFFLLSTTLLTQVTHADQFHYNNVLMGDRAAGLGGAFGAVSDDASGVHYNPAGLGFALSNDISGSANALYGRKLTYKKAAFGTDFVENSQGTLAPFFGALGKLDHISQGLVFAFGYMTTDSELKDQDDLINSGTNRFHRTANTRANTNKFGLAVGKRFGSSISLGGGINYLWVDELAQVYQDFTGFRQGYAVDADGKRTVDANGNQTASTTCCYRTLTQNVRERLEANAIEPTLGIQYAFLSQMSIGLTLKKPIVLSQRYETGFERTILYRKTDDLSAIDVDETGVYDLEAIGIASAQSIEPTRTQIDSSGEKNPLGDMPTEARLSYAWFASTTALITADLSYYTATKGKLVQYERDAVINYAIGTEYYINPSWPIRLGLFTNNDARPVPTSSKTDQPDHIDYTGFATYLAFVQPNSQIAFGGVVQQGKGKAQKIAGSNEIQDIEAFAWTAGFSVSHNF
jgi:long-subunit fatty acid transport protein